MESDSESRSNSSIILKSTSTSDVTSESKESHSEDEITEIKPQTKLVSEDDCEIMEVDTNENSLKTEDDLQNGGDEHIDAGNENLELSPSNEVNSRESHTNGEPFSTEDLSSMYVLDSDKEDEPNAASEKDPELGAGMGDVTETDDVSEGNEHSNEKVDSDVKKDDSFKMDVEASESENHEDVSQEVSSSKESLEKETEPPSSQDKSSHSVEASENSSDVKPGQVNLDVSETATGSQEEAELDEKSSPKEKGIGIDAIAKKLGLQIKVSNEQGDKETSEEVVDEVSSTEKEPSEAPKDTPPETKTEDVTTAKSEAKEKKKSKKHRTCEECSITKKLRFQVLFQGKMRYLCSDVCFKNFKEKQKPKKSTTPPPPATPDSCAQCKKMIKDGKGYFPMVGAIKPLCSVDCLVTYQEYNVPKRKCSQCKTVMEDELNTLTWETMEFCNEECLGKFQSFLGSHCTCCQSPVQQTSLGKYCVCFGSDIRQFCSGTCLEEFKKGLKVCSFCQKDLSAGPDGFLAPVGEKGQFKDFCSQPCMERYEIVNSKKAPPETETCACCMKMGIFKIHVTHGDKSAALCCDNCVAGYRYKQKIMLKVCEICYKLFEAENEDEEFQLQFEGVNKFYCSKACMTLFVLSNRKIVGCSWCKVKKYNFDMIELLDSSHQMQIYCSLNCISLFRVSLSATSAKSIRCDHCSKTLPAQFHLTMSDGSIRNFCTYQCVAQFQNQFTNAPSLTTSTMSTRQNTATTQSQATKTTASSSSLTPVISSVVSLAGNPRSPNLNITKLVNPQKLITPSRTVPSAITILAAKPQTPAHTSSATSSATTVTSSLGGTQILREVIVKPPQPKSMKNKAILCKPIMLTKGISCKPHPCHKAVQTDDGPVPSIIPIPVPVYVPTPVHMFSRPVPCPVPFPVPIPVPIFIPLSKESPARVVQQLKDLQEKIPSNPFEAELLMMAEMVAENDDKTDQGAGGENVNNQENVEAESMPPPSTDITEDLLDIEAELPSGIAPVLQKEPETQFEAEPELSTNDGRQQRKRSSSGRGRGRGKRPRVDIVSNEGPDNFPAMPCLDEQNSTHQTDSSDTTLRLKHMFGVNAWKHWVLQKNVQLENGSQSSRRFKLFKTDLLQLPHDELNYSLCLFVKEVRKPTGEEYAPASIYYLCLGIQQYLFENGRIDNIFTDPYYEKFTDCLNDVLLNQVQLMTAEGFLISRIEEEILWESKQLGAHSPHVLLNTLMFFNTKHFNLKAIDEHMHLSFSNVTKHWKKATNKSAPRNVVLRYYAPIPEPTPEDGEPPPPPPPPPPRRRKEDTPVCEQNENLENPLRCPVKLYEFYLSKCPESVKARNESFYLYPERSCVPDSPVWYSTQSLGREMVAKMMQRIKAVREIYET